MVSIGSVITNTIYDSILNIMILKNLKIVDCTFNKIKNEMENR